MKKLMTVAILLGSLSANASSGQALRQNLAAVAKSQHLIQKISITAQLCDSTENVEYTLFTKKNGALYAIDNWGGFSSSNGDEGIISADTAELINLTDCTTKSVRF